jgi:hypothetical protein
MKVFATCCIAIFSLFIIGCTKTGNIQPIPESAIEKHNSEESLSTVSGTIMTKSTQGGDGAIWEFKGNDGMFYSLVVSIPNLGREESKNIKYVIPNAKLTIMGEKYKLGSKYNIIARKITNK